MVKESHRFLFINSFYSPDIGGGAEIIMKVQAEGLARMGYDVSVLATSDKKGLLFEIINGVKVYRAGLHNFYWHFTQKKAHKLLRLGWHVRDMYNFQMTQYVREVLNKEKSTIVFAHNIAGWSISIFDEIQKFKIPIVQVLHDQYFRCPNSNMFKGEHACLSQCMSCSIFRFPHKKASRKVTAVVGVSSFVVEGFIKEGFFYNVPKYIINNAREIDIEKTSMFSELNRPLRFGYLGTLAKAKGLEWLIEEFVSLDIDATLVIGGKGIVDYEIRLKELAKNSKIVFLGYVNPAEFYSQIDVSVVPSIWPDTFPGVAFESAAYSVPVIASKIGGLPEIIKDNENGLLCDPSDPKSLGRAMKRLSDDRILLNNLISKSHESVKSFLSVERMLAEYIELCDSLLYVE
jgi:glycosyltransferase involved in cell wall biosynthesis